MRKLTDKTKYSFEQDYAVIWAKPAGKDEFVKAFTCHLACIPLIKQANTLKIEGIVLQVYK